MTGVPVPPLARAQPVTIKLPTGGLLVARVDHADPDGGVTLVLPQRPERPVRSEDCTIEFTTRRGVHRLSGTLRGEATAPEIVRLLPKGAPEVVQRRDYVRVDAVVAVTLTRRDEEGRRVRTTSLNVSGGGLLIADPLGLALHSEIDVDIHLGDDNRPVTARAAVVRETPAGEKGLQIVSLDDRERERLIRWVTERERAALRMTRDG